MQGKAIRRDEYMIIEMIFFIAMSLSRQIFEVTKEKMLLLRRGYTTHVSLSKIHCNG